MSIQIRSPISFEINDIIDLLKKCDLYYPENDTPENLLRKLRQDRNLMLVAADEGDHIMGFVMGSYDGWVAMVCHLVVEPRHQRSGIGMMLLKELESRLAIKGANMLYGLVLPHNKLVLDLLGKGGFLKETTTWVVSKPIR
jgi:predicted N-acetyltransferase YhbS